MLNKTLSQIFATAGLILTTALPSVFGQSLPAVASSPTDSTLIQTVKSKLTQKNVIAPLPIISTLQVVDPVDGDTSRVQCTTTYIDSTAQISFEELPLDIREKLAVLDIDGATNALEQKLKDVFSHTGDISVLMDILSNEDSDSYARLDKLLDNQIAKALATGEIPEIAAMDGDLGLTTNITYKTAVDMFKQNAALQTQYNTPEDYYAALKRDTANFETTLPNFDIKNPVLVKTDQMLVHNYNTQKSNFIKGTPITLKAYAEKLDKDGDIYTNFFPAMFNVDNAYYTDQAPEIGNGDYHISSNMTLRENALSDDSDLQRKALEKTLMTMAHNLGVTGTHAMLEIMRNDPSAKFMTVDDFYDAHPEYAKLITRSAFKSKLAAETSAPETITIAELLRGIVTRELGATKQDITVNASSKITTVIGMDQFTIQIPINEIETIFKGLNPYFDIDNMAYGAMPGKDDAGNANLRTTNIGLNYVFSKEKNGKKHEGSIGGGYTVINHSKAEATLDFTSGTTYGHIIDQNDVFGTTALNGININANDLLNTPLNLGDFTITQDGKNHGAHIKGAYEYTAPKMSYNAAAYVAGSKEFAAGTIDLGLGVKNKKGAKFSLNLGGGYGEYEVDQGATYNPIVNTITSDSVSVTDVDLEIIDFTLTPDSTIRLDTVLVVDFVDLIDSTAITTSTPIYDYFNDSTFVQNITSVDSFVYQQDPYICEWITFYDTTNILVNVTTDSLLINTIIDTTGWTYDTTQIVNIDPNTGDTIFVIDVINTFDAPLLNANGQQIFTPLQQNTNISTQNIATFDNTLVIDPKDFIFNQTGRLEVLDLNANIGYTTPKGFNVTAYIGGRKINGVSQQINGNAELTKTTTQTFDPADMLAANANSTLIYDGDNNVIGENQGTGALVSSPTTQTTATETRDNPFGISIDNKNTTVYGGGSVSMFVAKRTRAGLSATFAKTHYTGDIKYTMNGQQTDAYTSERTINQTVIGANLSHVFRNNISLTAGYGYNIVNGNKAAANMNAAIVIPLSTKKNRTQIGKKPVRGSHTYEYTIAPK